MISKNVQEMIPKIQDFCVSHPIKKAWLFTDEDGWYDALSRRLAS